MSIALRRAAMKRREAKDRAEDLVEVLCRVLGQSCGTVDLDTGDVYVDVLTVHAPYLDALHLLEDLDRARILSHVDHRVVNARLFRKGEPVE